MGVKYKSAPPNNLGGGPKSSPLSKPTISPQRRRQMNGRKEGTTAEELFKTDTNDDESEAAVVDNDQPTTTDADDNVSNDKPSKMSFAERFLPLPHVLDVRSLALFRILFGLCQLGDIYGRLCTGKYDLAWYTSYPEERSYYYPNMEVQQFEGPLGQLPLFRRNSAHVEIIFFVIYFILLTMLTVGFQCQNIWLLPTIWLFTNGLLSKGDAGSWGSDQLAQQLLIWMIFLPLSEEWSVDAWLRRRRRNNNIPSSSYYDNHQVKSMACLGLTLLINMMYLGCTLERTYHTYTWETLHESDWLWPDFPLVWYASNGSGTYNTWLTKLVRETAVLNQFMTFSGFLIELLMPPLCLLFNQRYSHWFAIHLFALHVGIGMIIAIPHFAAMAALVHVIWIPTHVWDNLLRGRVSSSSSSSKDDSDVVTKYKNANGVQNGGVTTTTATHESTTNQPHFVWRGLSFCVRSLSVLLQVLFLVLLVATFCNAHGWWREETEGVTTMAWKYLLMNNEWGMWSPGAERISPYTVILGWRVNEDEDEDDEVINLFHFLKTGREEVEFDGFSEDYLADSTYLYPSTRWEKAIGDDWSAYLQDDEYNISDKIMVAWCHFINEDMTKLGRPPVDAIEIRLHLRAIGNPDSGERYTPSITAQEGSLTTMCFPDEEDDEDEEEEDDEEVDHDDEANYDVESDEL